MKSKVNPNAYLTKQEHSILRDAKSFDDLAVVAVKVIERLPQPLAQVCGPISTGGLGSIEKNLVVFKETIYQLQKQGVNVFNQMPFEEHIFRVVNNEWGTRQNNQLLEEFYQPIFNSGFIKKLYFITDWESSDGARWEHGVARDLGIEIVYL